MNLIDFEDGTFTFTKGLSAEEVQRIKDNITMGNVTLNYRDITSLNVYSTSAGVMATFEDELNLLFDSLIDLNKAIDNGFYTEVVGREIMFKKNPYGSDFPVRSMELVAKLLQEFEIDSNKRLDVELLNTIEEKVRNLPRPYHFYRSRFIEITALLGEAIKKDRLTLQWHMELAKDKQTWNPYLLGKNGKYPFFVDLYELLFIENRMENILSLVFEIHQ